MPDGNRRTIFAAQPAPGMDGKEIPMTDAHSHPTPLPPSDDPYTAHALGRVRDALSGLRYGEVTVVVQDGVVVQVERTEKVRLARR